METLDNLMSLLEGARAEIGTVIHARNTVRGYAYDWQRFERWCQSLDLTPLPADPETLELYVTARLSDGHKTTTVARDVSAVVAKHCAGAFSSPAAAEVWDLIEGARRKALEKRRQMLPLRVEDVRAIATRLRAKGTKRAMRNRALILVGFTTALRGSTLGEIRIDDLEFRTEGVIVHVRREKQDQAARGRDIGIPRGRHIETCPVRALEDWLALRGDAPGPVFGLCCEAIRVIVKGCVRMIGLDPAGYGSHSLRAGFITAAGEGGAGELLIAAQTGHRTMAVLRQYFRRSDLFRANACSAIDL